MSLRSASVAAAGQTALKFGAGLGLLKILALSLGPSGLASFGQVQSSFILLSGIAALFGSNGLTSLIASSAGDARRQAKIVGTSLVLTAAVIASTCLALPVLNLFFGARLFGVQLPAWLVALIGLGIVTQATSLMLIAIFTGHGAMKAYGILTSIGPVTLLLLSLVLAPLAGLEGAAASLALSAVITSLMTIEVSRRKLGIDWRSLGWDTHLACIFLRFAALGLVSLIATPLSQIVIRQMLSHRMSIDVAGTWHAAMRLSEALLAPIVTLLTIYLLPRQAAADAATAHRTAWRTAFCLLPVTIASAALLLAMRHQIVLMLFSSQFLGMTHYLNIQLAGDIVRVTGWVFAYTLLSRGFALRLAALEALHAVLWPLSTAWWAGTGDVAAASKGYLLSNLVYMILVASLARLALDKSNHTAVEAQPS